MYMGPNTDIDTDTDIGTDTYIDTDTDMDTNTDEDTDIDADMTWKRTLLLTETRTRTWTTWKRIKTVPKTECVECDKIFKLKNKRSSVKQILGN
jgi:hypothetical protein